jgi:hypothetical protein
MVAHAYNPSYLGGRDQEDRGLKAAQANSSARPYLQKKPSQQKGWWSGSRCRPWVRAQYHKKKKKKKIHTLRFVSLGGLPVLVCSQDFALVSRCSATWATLLIFYLLSLLFNLLLKWGHLAWKAQLWSMKLWSVKECAGWSTPLWGLALEIDSSLLNPPYLIFLGSFSPPHPPPRHRPPR